MRIVARSVLAEAGIEGEICRDLPALTQAIAAGAGVALVTDEAIRHGDLQPLAAWIEDQPPWSDFPFVLLTIRGGGTERNPAAQRLAGVLGNVTFLERPFHPMTLISTVSTALRGRRRQYEARARLEEVREGEERLRLALRAGRLGSWELDLTTLALTASERCKANFGRPAQAVLSYADLVESVHPADRSRMQAAVADFCFDRQGLRHRTPGGVAGRHDPLGRDQGARGVRQQRPSAPDGRGIVGHHRPEGGGGGTRPAERSS